MRFDVITLFPELFAPFLTSGITRRAFDSGAVDVRLWNPRDHAQGNYRRVDDRPFGGGPGMVMMVEPLARCLAVIREDRATAVQKTDSDQSSSEVAVLGIDGNALPRDATPVVLFSPLGAALNHAAVEKWSGSQGAILLCGRYEGIDQRFIDAHVDIEISLGDFVLSGGEIAALALLDAVARLQPGVLNSEGSHQLDSFNPALDGLLDCPHFTRPEVWQCEGGNVGVPEVLLSGHHTRIERWRRDQRVEITARLRPDLLEAARAAVRLSPADEAVAARVLPPHS